MGPLNMKRQKEIVIVSSSRLRRGAEVIELGSYVDGARGTSENYLLPTLRFEPCRQPRDRHRRAVRPVASDHRYANEADAVAQANNTWSDCAHRWSSDLDTQRDRRPAPHRRHF